MNTTATPNLETLAAKLQALQDRADIAEMMMRYGRALDTHDWTTFRNLFAEDLHTEHGVVAPPIDGRENFIGFLQTFKPNARYVQHFVTNPEVTVNGETAKLSAFILAMHDVPRGDGSNEVIPAGGHYEVSLRRTADGWKIYQLIVHETWVDDRVPAIYAPH